jgi:hypothetical protein
MTTSLNPPAILAISGTLAALAAAPVMAGSLDASMADALSARFTSNGFLTTLPAVAPVHGSAQPSYNKQDSLPGYNKTLIIADKLEPPPALYAYLTGIWNHVMGSGVGVDSYGSEGDTKIATAELSLNLNPPPPTAGIVPLLISATRVHASASYRVVRRSTLVSGTANFGELIITGSLLGGRDADLQLHPACELPLVQQCRGIDHTERTSGNNGDVRGRPRVHRHPRRHPCRGGARCSDEG